MQMKYVDKVPTDPVVPKKSLGMPRFVDHERDMALHLGLHTDSNFVTTNMKGDDGREFNFIIHHLCVNPKKDPEQYPLILSIVSLTDRTNRWYTQNETVYTADQFSVSTERLDIKTPISSISGTLDKMALKADLPDGKGKIDVTLERTGPVLDNCALGYFPFLNNEVVVWQYALPYLKATGTLTLDNKTTKISGDAWLDRQWNDMSQDFFDKKFKWKWMNLNLDNGYKISVWDMVVHGKNENAWATVLSPKGVHTVVDVVPLSKWESDPWVSPVTNQKYPTRYVVEIPDLETKINVKVYDGMPGQEIVSPSGDDKYEAHSTFEGTFMGKKVKGFNCVELVGNYR
jgi:predicted secreted hydrolase